MTTFVIRNGAGVERALVGLNSNRFTDIRFEGWPRLVLQAEHVIDVMRNARRLDRIREAVARQFCLIRYASGDLRRLSRPEREAELVKAHYEDGGKRLVLDFSHAANACLRAVRENARKAAALKPGRLLFGDDNEQPEKSESRWRTIRETAQSMVRELGPNRLMLIGMMAVVAGFAAWTEIERHDSNNRHGVDALRETHRHQERLAEIDRTTFVRMDGSRVKDTTTLERAMRAEEEDERHRVRLLGEMELEYPLVRFVVAEAREARPLVLGLAPQTGTTRFNGRGMEAPAIRAWAKQLQQVAHVNAQSQGEWIPKVTKEPVES